jgi:hypothetical protein
MSVLKINNYSTCCIFTHFQTSHQIGSSFSKSNSRTIMFPSISFYLESDKRWNASNGNDTQVNFPKLGNGALVEIRYPAVNGRCV